MTTTKIYGAPGTGKTTRLISEFSLAVKNGTQANRIMYNTYRKEATKDAKTRISLELGVPIKDLKYVKTTHGICLSLLYQNGLIENFGETPDGKPITPIIQSGDFAKFNAEYGYDIKPTKVVTDNSIFGSTDPYLSWYGILRSMRISPSSIKAQSLIPDTKATTMQLRQFITDFENWKGENYKLDFSDIVDMVLRNNLCPDCPIQIYDEAQDMTTQLHEVAKVWASEADEVFLAGDPLQTLYPFWGADPTYFMEWPGELLVLPESRRLPQNIWKIAGEIIKYRTPYTIPKIKTKDETGRVINIESSQLENWLGKNKKSPTSTVYHLVRTTYTAMPLANILAKIGIPFGGLREYSWKKSEIDLYNAIISIRGNKKLEKDEFCALIDVFSTEYGLSSSRYTKRELIHLVSKGDVKPAIDHLSYEVIEDVKSKYPLSSSNLKGLSRAKLDGAIAVGLPRLTREDVDKTQILTIHGAKGMEADTIFLHTQMTPAVTKSFNDKKSLENEAYVWYVAVTRTKKNLFCVTYGNKTYPIPGVCC